MSSKYDICNAFSKFVKVIQNKFSFETVFLRSIHGGDFFNHHFEDIFDEFGYSHNFSCHITPQQNGVIERKNIVLKDLARTVINEMNLPKYLWVVAINTVCHILNRIVIRPIPDKTPYELIKGRNPNLSYLIVFGCKCFILNNGKDKFGKFDGKVVEGIFLGYSYATKTYRVYNKHTLIVEESVHVSFDETLPQVVGKGMSSFDAA